MRGMKRILAMLLAVVMVVGLIPATVFAADTVLDAAVFCSDVHGSTSDLTSVLSGVKTSGVDYSSIGFVGDTCLTVANTTSVVQSALGDTNIDVMFSYASSHDTEDGADINKNWDYSGEVEGVSDYYLVYTIRETDMKNNTTAEADFTTWYNGLTAAEKALPIFIMSHRPLHARRSDNANAADWYNVISAAAESSDIVFFWGHNHTGENSTDTNAYYVAKDGTETFTVYNGETVTPNFTYMNAGYINANNQNPGRINVATTVQITADSLIFQDYTTSGTYTGSYAHNVTVAREFAASEPAATLSSIEVSGTTEYTVGGNGLELTVTATYSDDSTADVTADATFEPAELTASGKYTVTASYGGMTDTIDVTVNLYDEVLAADGESLLMGVEAFSQGATALEVAWDDAADAVLEAEGLYTDYVVYDLALTNPGETTTYSMTLVDNMDTTNLAVYHVAKDGTLTAVPYTIKNDCVVFTTSLTGTFAYGNITVPAGYTLQSVTLANIPTDLFVGGSLDLMNAVITATYTKEGAEDFVRQLTVYDYDENNFSGYDINVAGPYTAVFTFEGVTATLDIHVWGHEFTSGDVTVSVDNEGSEYGVTKVNVAESTNTNVATAIQYVITGNNYVAYDITLTYENGYSETEDAKTVTLPIPEGVTNPVVYYVSDSGKSVVDMGAEITEDGKHVTFTTTHFSTYVLGDGTTIETESENATTENTTTTTTKTVYVLTSSISSGTSYLIVNGNSAGDGYYALANNSGSVAATDVTVQTGDVDGDGDTETYIELTDATDELWTVGSGYTFLNGSYYLGYTTSGNSWNQSYNFGLSTTSRNWSYSTSNNRLSISVGNWNSTTYYLRYNSGWTWTSSNSASGRSVFFYVPTEITVTTGTPGHTYSVEGTDMEAAAVKDATVDLSSILYDTPTDTNVKTDITAASGLTPTYEVVATKGNPNVITSISGNTATLSGVVGTAVVKVTYTSGNLVAWDEFTVTTTTPDHYSIQLHEKNGDTYGDEITAPVALKGVKAGDTYSVWAVVKAHASADDTTGTDLGTLGNALSWTVSDTSIATIDTTTGVITFTGNNYGTFDVTVAYEGADGKVITDTITISATKSSYIVPGDGTDDFPEYPNEGAVRFDKTATAVGNYSETGLALVELSMTGVPYTTGNELDVVLMLDMTGSMDDVSSSMSEPTGYVRIDATIAASKAFIETIVKNEDGSYNDNRVGVYVFNKNGAATLYDFGTVDDDTELEAIYDDLETIKDDHFASGGTPYDDGLAKCQSVLASAKTDGIGNDRQQFCVFMTDGVPTDFEYVNGTSHANYSSASSIAGMLTSASDYATRDTDYKYEYYSTEMKKAGVTVYSVGVGLFNENNAWSGSATQCGNLASALLNDISGPGGETTQPDAVGTSTLSKKDSYFFSVDDADAGTEMAKIFKNIAVQILEAAKDVVVEDMIGSDYTINFSIPGYGTDAAVSSEALDGLTEFYIQAVEYQLDANKNRTGDPAILENFTFNADGSLKSHTVDGVTCTTCTTDDPNHVVFTDGVVTAINGTYFTYVSNADGEVLTWEADKLTTTELALQYFAYLDNSSGLSEEEIKNGEQVKPGTYYTNEYATLTYTNFQGKQVQQEFPIPQMTWNGAQVSYVFYLVNAAGQPVNTAGRVVPFSEAVYVTDIYTHNVIWNDLEQSTSLDAEYLAQNLIPDVYELYDDDASYSIHVYEDEAAVNLNNHFIISGDVTDDYNTTSNSWTNANTTYVFNTKADTAKYNANGAYIANDGNDSVSNKTYHCKSETIVGATYTTSVDAGGNTIYTVTSVGDGYQKVDGETQTLASSLESTTGGTVIDGYVYYVDDNGKVYTIVTKTNGGEVRDGFDFHNTTVAFAVVWKPQLVEDTVVVDYGLDVVIDVIKNDNMAAGVVGVRADKPDAEINSGNYTASETTIAEVKIGNMKIGTATVENLNEVRFSLDKTNGMQFTEPAVFYYEADVNYYDSNNKLQTPSMYSSVTVIPATTVYYEDTFVTFSDNWSVEGTTSNKTQDVDRPGTKTISEAYDANNVYGYDSAYETMSTYSMGAAHKVHVDANSYGTATFSFYGTGFDVISMTSNTTGTITVKVMDANGAKVEAKVVNTYYGYTKNEDGSWTATPDTAVALYQVPVMQVNGLAYGQYTVTITATWAAALDKTNADGYDLYLDAIRIYDPIGVASNSVTNDVVSNAYKDDGEGWPTYMELRNQLLTAKDFEASLDSTVLTGAMFIDGISALGEAQIADYTSYGPNNEVYLAPGQGVAFTLTNADRVHVGMRRMTGTATYTIESYDEDGKLIKSVTGDVTSATDMYYDITDLKDGTIVIRNSGTSGELMLTNLKYTFESNPASAQVAMFMTMRRSAMVLSALNTVEESTETEDTVTDGNTNTGNTTGDNTNTEVEDTVTEPEVDVTEPEVDPTEPETDKPAEDIPEEEIPEVTPPAEEPSVQQNFWTGLWNAIKSAFSRLFGWAGI